MNSIQPTEWEKRILKARKQKSETELFVIDYGKLAMKWPLSSHCFCKLEVFKQFLVVGGSAACRSRRLLAQGQGMVAKNFILS